MSELVKGFLRTEGRKMVNGDGQQVLLRGWGAGNWMNPEGFMITGVLMGLGDPRSFREKILVTPSRYDRARTMKQAVRELCGTEYANAFLLRWYRAHLGEGDLREMSKWGYNSVRLPLDAAALLDEEPGIHFNEEGFSVVDDLLDLCEKYGLYAILDLHGTPGHSGAPCDNGIDNVPRVFTEPETFERMGILWEEIARRYRDRWIVGAYELLNEPVFPVWLELKDRLVEFYDAAIARIRAVDQKHMLILSGPQVGTDQSIYTKDFDPVGHNWAYTFHGYHWAPEEASFQKYLETSYRLNIPCIHGEGREAVHWMPTYYQMLEKYDVGWNLFCWKSEGDSGMENGPVTHTFPAGWEQVIEYITKGGPRPSYADSQKLFDQLLDCVKFENCQVKCEMFKASMRKPGIVVGGAGYDCDGEGVSFSGGWKLGNGMNFRLTDGTKLVLEPGAYASSGQAEHSGLVRPMDPIKKLRLVLEPGAFACYSVLDVKKPSTVTITTEVPGDRAVLLVSCGEQKKEVVLTHGEHAVECLTISQADKATVKLEGKEGAAQIITVAFSE